MGYKQSVQKPLNPAFGAKKDCVKHSERRRNIAFSLSVAAGACVIKVEGQEKVETPQLEMGLATLKRAYKRGAIDKRGYEIRQEMLITAWELKVQDQRQSGN